MENIIDSLNSRWNQNETICSYFVLRHWNFMRHNGDIIFFYIIQKKRLYVFPKEIGEIEMVNRWHRASNSAKTMRIWCRKRMGENWERMRNMMNVLPTTINTDWMCYSNDCILSELEFHIPEIFIIAILQTANDNLVHVTLCEARNKTCLKFIHFYGGTTNVAREENHMFAHWWFEKRCYNSINRLNSSVNLNSWPWIFISTTFN